MNNTEVLNQLKNLFLNCASTIDALMEDVQEEPKEEKTTWLTMAQISNRLGIKTRTIRSWVESNRIRSRKDCAFVECALEDIEEILRAKSKKI